MKERPILFSAAMVRALLAGTKTQTRRVVRPQPADNAILPRYWSDVLRRRKDPDVYGSDGLTWGNVPLADGSWGDVRCPYGQQGDRLWVKETWRPRISHGCSMDACDCDDVHVTYAADGERSEGRYFRGSDIPDSWSMPKASERGNVSPLFMPSWASRLTLEITGVRVERLQAISEEDARAEGVKAIPGMSWHSFAEASAGIPMHEHTAIDAYAALWESINGAGSWDANPWVWVIEFTRVTP